MKKYFMRFKGYSMNIETSDTFDFKALNDKRAVKKANKIISRLNKKFFPQCFFELGFVATDEENPKKIEVDEQ